MPLETGTYLNSLVAANPAHDDQISEADSHIRRLKAVLLATFPNLNAAVTATPADLNALAGNVASLQSQITAEVANRTAAVTAEAVRSNTVDVGLATDYTARDAVLTTDYVGRDTTLRNEYVANFAAQGGLITAINSTLPTLMPFGSIQFATAGNGCYAHIPNGTGTSFLIQVGYSGALATGSGDGVPFPVSFPNACFGVIVSNATPGSLAVAGTLPTGAGAASGFVAYAKVASSGAAAPGAAVYFIAMGF